MESQNREDLRELVARFFEAEQAESCLQDFQEGERILRENPVPKPNDTLIANIKAEIGLWLPIHRARLSRHRLYRRAGVAAAIVLVSWIGTLLFNQGPSVGPGRVEAASLWPTAIWESNDIAADDENLVVFTAAIDQIEDEVMTLEADDDTYQSDKTLDELEMELVVVRNDFWKE